MTPREPKRIADIERLRPSMRESVIAILAAMVARGWDPIIFETLRSAERQGWLYGVGRSHSLKRKPVTWTLSSAHLLGYACDIISKKHGWSSGKFFVDLEVCASMAGCRTLRHDRCHVEWAGLRDRTGE